MRKRLLASLGALLTSTSMALSQAPAPPALNEKIAAPAEKADGFVLPPHGNTSTPAFDDYHGCVTDGCAADCGKSCGPHVWASGEYLLWWVKSAPLPVPLLTIGNPAVGDASGLDVGALGRPGTVILSPNQQNFGPLSSGRATVGAWLNQEQTFGVEASGFLTEARTNSFFATISSTSPLVLAVPFNGTFGSPTFKETAIDASIPGLATGTTAVSSAIHLWGTEANGVVALLNNDMLRVNLLGGFRYLDLDEKLDFRGANLFLDGSTASAADHFGTRNQIYAGQLGARAEVSFDPFFVSLTAKVGLGSNHESVDIHGNTFITPPPGVTPGPGFVPVFPGGVFAEPTNIGRRTRDEFVVMPEVRLQAGINLCQNIRVFAGYEFLYVSSVVRPGDQIDRTINATQRVGFPLIGTPRPAPLFNSTDFWAQGLSAGMEFRF